MKISIITINYNNKAGLTKTLKSVLEQDAYTNIEYIVIDGGSTDGSRETIEKIEDKLAYWVSESDSGIFNAMNKGLAKVTGDYIIFINSGDTLYDKTVISQFLSVNRYLDVYIGDTVIEYSKERKQIWKSPDNVSMRQLFSASVSHQATFFKKDIIIKYGFDESLKIVSDWKLFLQLFMKDDCTYEKLPFIVCTFEWGGISSTDTCNYKERDSVLRTFYSDREIMDFNSLVKGGTKEEQLFKEINLYCTSGRFLIVLMKIILKLQKIR